MPNLLGSSRRRRSTSFRHGSSSSSSSIVLKPGAPPPGYSLPFYDDQPSCSAARNGQTVSGRPSASFFPRACDVCGTAVELRDADEGARHLRTSHSKKEGGSYVCRYGPNGVCPSMPPEGVSDVDYETHIRRLHLAPRPTALSRELSSPSPATALVAGARTAASEDAHDRQNGQINAGSLRGMGGREEGRAGTTATSSSTTGGSRFTISSFTQNLSSVLADPTRSSQYDVASFFTRHWGDSFVANATIPARGIDTSAIDKKVLAMYLASVGDSFDRVSRARKRHEEAQLAATEGSDRYDPAGVADIPKLFTDASFILQHTATFAAIFGRALVGVEDPLFPGKIKKKSTNPFDEEKDRSKNPFSESEAPFEWRPHHELQTRLEQLHDIVDSRLAARLAERSGRFFEWVHSFGSLGVELEEALEMVRRVRETLRLIANTVLDRSARLLHVYQRREHLRRLLLKLEDVSCVRAAQPTVQMLLNSADYPRALECIATSRQVLKEELKGVRAFRHLSSQLAELHNVIGRMMQDEFIAVVQKELGAHWETTDHLHHEGELSSLLLGLLAVGELRVLPIIRAETADAVKAVVRHAIKRFVLDRQLQDLHPLLGNLGELMLQIDWPLWLEALREIQLSLGVFVQKMELVERLLVELVQHFVDNHKSSKAAAAGTSPSDDSNANDGTENDKNEQSAFGVGLTTNAISSEEEWRAASPLRTVNEATKMSAMGNNSPAGMLMRPCRSLDQLIEATKCITAHARHSADERLARLVTARLRSQTQQYDLPTQSELARLSPKQWQAFVDCLTGWIERHQDANGGDSARGTTDGGGGNRTSMLERSVDELTALFVDHFHHASRARISESLDTELWKPATTVPSAIRRTLTALQGDNELQEMDEGDAEKDDASGGAEVQVLGERYTMISCTCELVRSATQYSSLVRVVPPYRTHDVLVRVVEILKTFNSRACQLVLGAGALQLPLGLKSISVKNLALAMRSLQLVVNALLPAMERQFERRLRDGDQGQLLRHFRHVQSDYTEHVAELRNKLIAVIDHLIQNGLAQWRVAGAVIPSPTFEQLVKQLGKFHAALDGTLHDRDIRQLFADVNTRFRTHFRRRCAELGVSPQDSLTFGLAEQDYAHYWSTVAPLLPEFTQSTTTTTTPPSLSDILDG